jgi:hypothetical protein
MVPLTTSEAYALKLGHCPKGNKAARYRAWMGYELLANLAVRDESYVALEVDRETSC